MTVMAFDEIHLTSLASYDSKLQCLFGPNSEAQTIMLRGLLSDWSFPIFFKFDFALDLQTYKEVITRLFEIKFIVKWSVCDQGPKNRALINAKNLNVTPTTPYFPHPSNENIKVHFSYDSIHLYKSLCAHVRDDESMLPLFDDSMLPIDVDDESLFPDRDTFTIDDFQEAVDLRGSSEIILGNHLRQKHIDASGMSTFYTK